MESAIAAKLQESEAVKTPMTNTLRSTPSRALVCLLAFLMARPHVALASAAPMADAAPASPATSENSADDQSGGVSPTDRLCTFKDPCESWPRYDARADLYKLVVKAINEPDRTTDQQNVADWGATAGQQLSIGAAQA